MNPPQAPAPGSDGGAVFATTRWSVVLAAGQSDSARSADALNRLCRAYWPPIYAYVRRAGYRVEDARDLTQDFFARLLAQRSLVAADPEKGRFRSFLLGALKHFLADARDRASAQKRGGGKSFISLDAEVGESSYSWEAVDDQTPEHLFERRWALTVMARAMQQLEEECRLAGKVVLFASLKGFLSEGAARKTYPDAAAELGLTEANVRMIVTRLRRRYGQIIRREVAQTVGSEDEADDELRHLLKVLRGE